jgi:hypothetical protein
MVDPVYSGLAHAHHQYAEYQQSVLAAFHLVLVRQNVVGTSEQ